MLSLGMRFGKYGAASTFYFRLEDVTITDAPFIGVAPLAADIFLSKDGGAPAAATNGMTAIGNGVYSWVATAAEMQCVVLSVSVYDQTATEIFKPVCVDIYTEIRVGRMIVDANAMTGDIDGLYIRGKGESSGIHAISGDDTGALKQCFGARLRLDTGVHGSALIADGSAGSGSGGFNALGQGAGAGATFRGGASGEGFNCAGQGAAAGLRATSVTGVGLKGDATGVNGVGAHFKGGPSGATAHGAIFESVDAMGLAASATGSGNGILAEAKGTGYGAIFTNDNANGGYGLVATSAGASGALFQTTSANAEQHGLKCQGNLAGSGIVSVGGATGQGAIFKGGVTSGNGLLCTTQAGNSAGIYAEGRGTAAGFQCHAAGTGIGFQPSAVGGGSKITTLFNQIENTTTDPGYVPGSNTMENLLMLIGRRFFSKVELVKSSPGVGTLTVYARNGTTVLAEGPVTEDLTTQTIGPLG